MAVLRDSECTEPAVTPTPIEAEVWRLWRDLRRGPAVRRLRQVILEDEEGTPLDVPQVDALEHLVTSKRMLMGELARELGIDASTATRAIDKLERRHLVRRKRASTNGRLIEVVATPLGERVCAHIVSNQARYMHSILEGFSESERAQLARLLRQLYEGVEKATTVS